MRDKIILFMFNKTIGLYKNLVSKKPWQVSLHDLELYPAGSLGFELKHFLQKNNFSLQEKLESHDVAHVLTQSGSTVGEEIGMQFYLAGNGKRNLYAYISMVAGLLFYPEKIKMFRQQFRFGKAARPFHQIDFRNLLHLNVEEFRNSYTIQNFKP